MTEVLIQGADHILTMDDDRRELTGADILVRDGQIAAVGQGLRTTGETVLAKGCVVTPGLVNTHHHLYQTLTRAVPGGQDALLFGWLKTLYPIWARFTPDHMHTSAQVGLAELALSGCTLSSDHLYLYPNGARLEDTIHAAAELGLRFHPTRGAMSIGESAGGRLSRSVRRVDVPRGRGPLFAVLGQHRADARRGAAGAGQGRDDAHPSG